MLEIYVYTLLSLILGMAIVSEPPQSTIKNAPLIQIIERPRPQMQIVTLGETAFIVRTTKLQPPK